MIHRRTHPFETQLGDLDARLSELETAMQQRRKRLYRIVRWTVVLVVAGSAGAATFDVNLSHGFSTATVLSVVAALSAAALVIGFGEAGRQHE